MSDEDILRQALKEGKVTIDGKDFSIKPLDPAKLLAQDPSFKQSYPGNFSAPTPKSRPAYQDDTRPEVALREGIRAAIRGGITREKIKEIFEHELVFGVMES